MSTCLFCSNRVVTRVTEHYVQEVMLRFFGYQIQDYLGIKDAICDTCFKGIDILGYIKQLLLSYIYREDPHIEQRKPNIIGTQWDYLASLNRKDIPWCVKSCTPNGSNGLNGLVACKRIEPYRKQQEKLFENLEHDRSLSRATYSQSDIDGEVESIFNKKRRRRKRNTWTHKKTSIYSRDTSPVSTIRTRSRRSKVESVASIESHTTNNSSISNLRYVDGCLINKRTRSVSRLQEEQAKLIFNNLQIYQCNDCDFLCESVDNISSHKQNVHNMMALFFCDDCANKYTTREELKTHENSEHSKDKFICTICRASFTTEDQYKDHWQIHVENSAICKYCKHRYFKTVITKHQKECRIARKTQIVVKNGFVKDQPDFQIKILIQDGVDTTG